MRYMIHTSPGLGPVLWREIRALDPDARHEGTRLVEDRNAVLLVGSREPEALLQSRIAEDVFALVAHGRDIQLGRRGLEQLSSLARAAPGWDEALRLHAGVTGGRGGRSTSTFRVISRAQGQRGYTRSEAGNAVAAGLLSRLGRRWQLVPDNAQVEVWLTLMGTEALLGVRLTGSVQRHRGKEAHLPASLRPVIAAALVFLSEPREDEVLLDPFCGAGTILVERAVAERHKLLIGSDRSEEALEAARANIGSRFKPLELHRWSATQIPLEEGSLGAIVTNPPFGRKVGSHTENEQLYPRFLSEARRLLRRGGRLGW